MKPDSLAAMMFVKSVPRSMAFYQMLGFSVGNTFTPPNQNEPTWAWLASNKAHLMVTRASEPVISEVQAVIFYLYCDDVTAYRDALRRQGVQVGEITYSFYSPRGEFRIADPDGYALMVGHTRP